MAFFKRVEVWVLLVLSAALIWFVLGSEPRKEDDPKPGPQDRKIAKADQPKSPPAPERVRLEATEVTRQGDHLVVSVAVSGHSRSNRAEPLDDTKARLVTASGAEVPWFFLAFDPTPTLPAPRAEGEPVRLRFWLPAAQSGEALWLEIDGERLPVKEAGAFPWRDLADNQAEVFSSSRWTP